MQDKKRSRQRAFSFMSAHRDCCSRPRDFGQMLCIEHIASFWCFRYDKQGNSPVGGKIDLVIQLRGAAEIDFQKERRNDETKTAISCSCLCHDGQSAHCRRKCGRAYLWRHRGPLGRGFHRPLERSRHRSGQQRCVCPPTRPSPASAPWSYWDARWASSPSKIPI